MGSEAQMKVDERQYFTCLGIYQAFRPLPDDHPPSDVHGLDMVPIKFTLTNEWFRAPVTETGRPLTVYPISERPITVVRKEVIWVSLSSLRLSSLRREQTETLSETVSLIFNHIVEERVVAIVDSIFKVIDSKKTVPLNPILVNGRNTRLSVYCSGALTVPVDTIRLPFVPPTPGFNSSPPVFDSPLKLEKVILNSLEAAGKTCPICIEDLEAGVPVVPLACSHLYHEGCIARWIRKGTCPMCRSPFFKMKCSRLERARSRLKMARASPYAT